jgi:hypothetical protein
VEASKVFISLEGTEPLLFQLLHSTLRNSSFSGLNPIQFNSIRVQPIATLHLSCSVNLIPHSSFPTQGIIHCHESGEVRGAQQHFIDHELRET